MAFEFRLPDIGEGVAEGEVVQWFVQEGQTVREDAPLVSVLTDKANVEIPSPRSGRIVAIHAPVGQKVKVGGLLVTIATEGEEPPGAASLPKIATGAGTAGTSAPARAPSEHAAPPADRSERLPPSPTAVSTSPALSPAGRVLAAPYVRRLASERGIDLSRVRGSGPGGRVVEADLDTGPTASAPTPSPAPPPSTQGPPAPRGPGAKEANAVERIPIRGIRRAIAEHMAESVHRAAHFTYVEEVDMSELVRLRERMSKHVEKDGVRLSYLPFIAKGVVAGLKAHPGLNATIDDARGEIVIQSGYHLGIATATPEGLIVPVIRDAEAKSLAAIAREIHDLAERGRAGKLAREELTGSTFTITSLGALGGVLATPILNYPQVAILGVHRIFRRPAYRPDGSVGPADLMNLSVSIDHRALDGYDAAQFIATVKSRLEDPHQLFAEMA